MATLDAALGPAPEPAAAPFRRHLPALAAVTLLGLAAYANAYRGPFVYDDLAHVRDNPLVHDLRAWFTPAGLRYVPNRWFAFVTFALNHALGGRSVAGYHAVNVAVHLATALLVYALVVVTFRTPRIRRSALAPHAGAIAFVAAALFVAHPLQTQAVTYVVQRMTSLATLLYVATVVLYARWRLAGRGAGAYAFALFAALLATRTKEIAFTLPFAIALYEASFLERAPRRWAAVLPFLGIALLIPLTNLAIHAPLARAIPAAHAGAAPPPELGRLDYLTTQLPVVASYLRLLALPVGQNVDHDFPVYRSLLAPAALAAAAVLGALAGVAVWLARRTATGAARPLDPAARVAAFGIGWWFLAIAVESSVIPIADVMNEHRVYLPSVGLLAAAAVGLAIAVRRLAGEGWSRIAVLAGGTVAVLLAIATLARNQVWTSDLALWSDAARKSPDKARPIGNVGTALVERGRFREAVSPLERAVALDPDSPWARVQLAGALLAVGRTDEAEPHLREALRLAPRDPEATFNLAMLLLRTGRGAEAKPLFAQFVEIAPSSYESARRFAAERAR